MDNFAWLSHCVFPVSATPLTRSGSSAGEPTCRDGRRGSPQHSAATPSTPWSGRCTSWGRLMPAHTPAPFGGGTTRFLCPPPSGFCFGTPKYTPNVPKLCPGGGGERSAPHQAFPHFWQCRFSGQIFSTVPSAPKEFSIARCCGVPDNLSPPVQGKVLLTSLPPCQRHFSRTLAEIFSPLAYRGVPCR